MKLTKAQAEQHLDSILATLSTIATLAGAAKPLEDVAADAQVILVMVRAAIHALTDAVSMDLDPDVVLAQLQTLTTATAKNDAAADAALVAKFDLGGEGTD